MPRIKPPEILEEPLTPEEVMQIPFIETFWNKNGFFPPKSKLLDRGIEDPERTYKKSAFIKAMENRGIIIGATEGRSPVDFSKAQLAAIMVMSDYLDKRSAHAKMRNLGLSTTQWNAWMKDKTFREYFHELTSKNFEEAISVIKVGLAKRAEEGNVDAIKYYYEVTGRSNNGGQTNQNLRLIITRLVEVLQRRISDPELLAAIGHDFQIILDGDTPPPQIPAESMLPGTLSEL